MPDPIIRLSKSLVQQPLPIEQPSQFQKYAELPNAARSNEEPDARDKSSNLLYVSWNLPAHEFAAYVPGADEDEQLSSIKWVLNEW